MPGLMGRSGPPVSRPDELAQRLARRTRCWGLLLDHDGTLTRFRLDPAQALPSSRTRAILSRLIRSGHRVCIVSGRPLRFLRAAYPLDGIDLAGSHGAEVAFADGQVVRNEPPKAALDLLDRKLHLDLQPRPAGLRLERKPFGLAVHVRAVDEGRRAAWLELVRAAMCKHLPRGFRLLEGSCVVEARPRGDGKAAVSLLLERCSGRWGDVPRLAIGDDRTDEEMFASLGLRDVGVVVAPRARASLAHVRLRGPGDVLRLLDCLSRST
jgi:trehalose-phosphatase